MAFADPSFRMSYPGGVPRVEISGDYPGSHYSVWRATALEGAYDPITAGDLLCLGSCYADDHAAIAGRTYWYRFDLAMPDGRRMSFGPYSARIAPEQARRIGGAVTPNPGRGQATLRLSLAGTPGSTPVRVEAALHDLQGRRVAMLHRGLMSPGSIAVAWDGRGSSGEVLPSGTYLLRVSAEDGRTAVARVQRVR
jgi:hypothetical protein